MAGDEGLKRLSGRSHVCRRVVFVTFTSLFTQAPPCLPSMCCGYSCCERFMNCREVSIRGWQPIRGVNVDARGIRRKWYCRTRYETFRQLSFASVISWIGESHRERGSDK